MRLLSLLLLASTLPLVAATPAPPPGPRTIPDLQREIEAVLKKTRTPGAAIAIVRRDGPEWVVGLGLADVAANKPATADTLFRIGSTSKVFVSLALLKLQAEGKLDLQDTLKSRAPDLVFENRWEETDPVRLVHLVEHTAGWDDLSLAEFVYDPPEEVSLRDGLAYRPKARTSRWRPGTRYSYSNAGPPAAAYVVEQVTGQRFEDYVEQHWFRPLGMNTASFMGTPDVLSRLAKGYRDDGVTPYPYWKIIQRPAGSINASATDMAAYVQFFLNRGAVGGVQLLPAETMDRIAEPTSTHAGREGLKIGYGRGIFTFARDGILYRGHGGGMKGALTDFTYSTDLGVGFCIMINSGSSEALNEIGSLVRRYLTEGKPRLEKPAIGSVAPELAAIYDGWYEPATPRQEDLHFMERLTGLARVKVTSTSVQHRPLLGNANEFVAVSGRFFRHKGWAVPTLALIDDRRDGTLIEIWGSTYRRVPAWLVWIQFALGAAVVLCGVASVLHALVWIPRKMFGRMRDVAHLQVRVWPLLAVVSAVSLMIVFSLGLRDPFSRLGAITPWSVAVFILTLALPALAIVGLVQAWRLRAVTIRPGGWWLAFSTSLAMTVVVLYLGYYGHLAMRTWA